MTSGLATSLQHLCVGSRTRAYAATARAHLMNSKINKMSKLHVVGVRRHVVGDVRQRRQVELPLLGREAVGRRRLR